MFTLRTFGNMRTLDAIATEAAHANYSVMLIPVVDATLEQVSGAFSRLSEQGVDGVIIVFEAHLLDNAEFTLPPGLPVVVIDSNAGDEYTVVDTDQAQGARQATEHLLGARPPAGVACRRARTLVLGRAPRRVVAAHAARTPASSRRRCCTATGPPNPGTGTA